MIDILMSTYNGSRFVAEQIGSIREQTYTDFRLVVRDDGSTDETVAIIRDLAAVEPRISLIEYDGVNLGAPASFMRLVELSTSPYFMFADQDDVWIPQKVERSFAKISKMSTEYGDDKPLLVFTDLKVVDQDLVEIGPSLWRLQKLDPDICRDWKRLLAQNVVTGCTIIANRAGGQASLPFALPEMMHDHWLAVNAAKYGHIDFLDDATVLYRQHTSNVEGSKNFGASYALSKIPTLSKRIGHFRRAAVHFGDTTAAELLKYKFTASTARFRRS